MPTFTEFELMLKNYFLKTSYPRAYSNWTMQEQSSRNICTGASFDEVITSRSPALLKRNSSTSAFKSIFHRTTVNGCFWQWKNKINLLNKLRNTDTVRNVKFGQIRKNVDIYIYCFHYLSENIFMCGLRKGL